MWKFLFLLVFLTNCGPIQFIEDPKNPTAVTTPVITQLSYSPASFNLTSDPMTGLTVPSARTTLTNVYFILQDDGNFVAYSSAGIPLWATMSFSNCQGNCTLSFQADGNLVLYNGSVAYWSTNTSSHPESELKLNDSAPYMTLLNTDGTVLYQSVPTSGLTYPRSVREKFNGSGLCLENSLNIIQTNCSGQAVQNFLITDYKSYYTLSPAQDPTKCLTLNLSTLKVSSEPCLNQDNQKWASKLTINTHTIYNPTYNLCLQAGNLNTDAEALPCSNATNNEFLY